LNTREESVAAEWREQGFEVVHRGWPDLLAAHPDGRLVAIEVKSPGDRVRPNQAHIHQLLRQAGIEVVVVTSREDQQRVWDEGMAKVQAAAYHQTVHPARSNVTSRGLINGETV